MDEGDTWAFNLRDGELLSPFHQFPDYCSTSQVFTHG
jgi:hypothetical protein